jgi:hypothetical protein
MKKILLLLFLNLALTHLVCQNIILIENKGFIGHIFPMEHFVFKSINLEKSRYTPTKYDIHLAECILNDSISFLKRNQKIQKNCPIISKKLEKYIRQYVGFINKNDEKILWINFIWTGYVDDLVGKEIIHAFDGGSFFWSICVNLTNSTLFDMEVNGVS